MYSVLSGAIINFTLNSLLIPNYGAFGAAIASVFAEFTVTAVQLYLARKIISVWKVVIMVLRYAVSSFFMSIPVILCLAFINNLILQCICGLIVGILAYLAILAITKDEMLFLILGKIKNEKK